MDNIQLLTDTVVKFELDEDEVPPAFAVTLDAIKEEIDEHLLLEDPLETLRQEHSFVEGKPDDVSRERGERMTIEEVIPPSEEIRKKGFARGARVAAKRRSEEGLHRGIGRPAAFKPERKRSLLSLKLKRQRPFGCALCDASFDKSCHLLQHMQMHPFGCKVCGANFIIKSQLTNHLKTHTDTCPFACCVCGTSFKGKNDLSSHTQSQQELYVCDACDASYTLEKDLVIHQHMHSKGSLGSCNASGPSFKENSRFVNKMRFSDVEYPFRCSVCSSYFKVWGALNQHVQKHRRAHIGL